MASRSLGRPAARYGDCADCDVGLRYPSVDRQHVIAAKPNSWIGDAGLAEGSSVRAAGRLSRRGRYAHYSPYPEQTFVRPCLFGTPHLHTSTRPTPTWSETPSDRTRPIASPEARRSRRARLACASCSVRSTSWSSPIMPRTLGLPPMIAESNADLLRTSSARRFTTWSRAARAARRTRLGSSR